MTNSINLRSLFWPLIFAVVSVGCSGPSTPNVRVHFASPTEGWIIGPRLLHTSDGGKNWQTMQDRGPGTVQVESTFALAKSTQFLSSTVGFQAFEDGLFKSVDGGRTWSKISQLPKTSPTEGPGHSLFFISPEEGWIFGDVIYHTADGGVTWTKRSNAPAAKPKQFGEMLMPAFYVSSMPTPWFIDPLNGVLARLDGDVYVTSDGGTSWDKVAEFDQPVSNLFFLDRQNGWIVGSQGLAARTSSGGRDWQRVETGTRANLKAVSFRTGNLGCAVGEQATIICTRDGGSTWEGGSIQGMSSSPTLASISFSGSSHGWAVGGLDDPMRPSFAAPSSVVLRTDDNGKTWQKLEP